MSNYELRLTDSRGQTTLIYRFLTLDERASDKNAARCAGKFLCPLRVVAWHGAGRRRSAVDRSLNFEHAALTLQSRRRQRESDR